MTLLWKLLDEYFGLMGPILQRMGITNTQGAAKLLIRFYDFMKYDASVK